jgi:hypothetical protein
MKLRLTLTALAITTMGFSGVADAAGLVTSNRPMPRPTNLGAKDGPAHSNTRTGLIPWVAAPGSNLNPNTGAQVQRCPC